MYEAFLKFISKNQLYLKRDKVLLAVSGGIDSVVMCALFHKSGFDFGIAHCNFQLRGEESDTDEDFVRQLAKELNVSVFVKAFDTQKYATENKLSIQVAARDLRYAWFEEIAKKEAFDYIAIAQHSDDQVETFFINLFRGSGAVGLKGMPLKRGKIIRPLLFASRNEIEQYAKENGLSFREDSSNTSDKYLRNNIRNKLIPKLEEVSPGAKISISKSMHFLQEDAILLQQLLTDKRSQLFINRKESIYIPLDELKKLSPLDSWLFYLLKDFNFNRQSTNALAALLQNEEITSSGKAFYSDRFQLLVDREFIIIQEAQPESNESIYSIHKTDHKVKTPVPLEIVTEENRSDYLFDSNPAIVYFDADKLKFPLIIRKWKQGDRFIPFGMKGSKLVSDFFIDKKLDRFAKDNCWLLLSCDQIIWIIGLRSSAVYSVNKSSKKVLKIQLMDS